MNMPRNLHLCTLFDGRYLPQGLALIESLEIHTDANIYWTVLALDEKAAAVLRSLPNPNIEVIEFPNFPDLELRALVGRRPWREICWTSASCLLSYCIDQGLPVDFVGYVDADCFFFGNIENMIDEIPDDKSIAIHEHKFSSDRQEWLQRSGRFNVGVVLGRPDDYFSECIKNWRGQVLSRCVVNFDTGECGDQTYLNDWPSRYPALHVFKSKGAGVAPWNLNNYDISNRNGKLMADNEELFFFHFHGLQVRYFCRFFIFFVPASGYKLKSIPNSSIYRPYVLSSLKFLALSGSSPGSNSLTGNVGWLLRNLFKGEIRLLIRNFRSNRR
jgi:hypothetical protein